MSAAGGEGIDMAPSRMGGGSGLRIGLQIEISR